MISFAGVEPSPHTRVQWFGREEWLRSASGACGMAWHQAANVMGTPRVDFFFKKERVQMMNGVKMKTEYRNVIEQYVK